MKEILLKGLSTGVIAGIATGLFFEEAGSVPLFGMSLHPGIVSGVSVSAGSVASDLIAENFIEQMNLPQNVKSTEEILLRTGICGLASSAVLMVGAGIPSENILKTVLLGGGSKLAGDYAYDMILSPQHGMMPQIF